MARILVVDDELAITDFVVEALSEEGHDVVCCHDGAAALERIRADTPDLVLLDIGLPIITGDAVLRTLRASGFERLAIIVATASTNAEQYRAQGATDVIKKPFTLDRLLSAVEANTSNIKPLRERAA